MFPIKGISYRKAVVRDSFVLQTNINIRKDKWLPNLILNTLKACFFHLEIFQLTENFFLKMFPSIYVNLNQNTKKGVLDLFSQFQLSIFFFECHQPQPFGLDGLPSLLFNFPFVLFSLKSEALATIRGLPGLLAQPPENKKNSKNSNPFTNAINATEIESIEYICTTDGK